MAILNILGFLSNLFLILGLIFIPAGLITAIVLSLKSKSKHKILYIIFSASIGFVAILLSLIFYAIRQFFHLT